MTAVILTNTRGIALATAEAFGGIHAYMVPTPRIPWHRVQTRTKAWIFAPDDRFQYGKLASPQEYHRAWGTVRRSDLPIIPEKPRARPYRSLRMIRDVAEGEPITIGASPTAYWRGDMMQASLLEGLPIGGTIDTHSVPKIRSGCLSPSDARLASLWQCRAFGDWLMGVNLSRAILIGSNRDKVFAGRLTIPVLARVQEAAGTPRQLCWPTAMAPSLALMQAFAYRKKGWPFSKTMAIAMSLYENALATYPGTTSRWLSDDEGYWQVWWLRVQRHFGIKGGAPSAFHGLSAGGSGWHAIPISRHRFDSLSGDMGWMYRVLMRWTEKTLRGEGIRCGDDESTPGTYDLADLILDLDRPTLRWCSGCADFSIGDPVGRHLLIQHLENTHLVEIHKGLQIGDLGREILSIAPPALRSVEALQQWEKAMQMVENGSVSEVEIIGETKRYVSILVEDILRHF
jgi:hypothetical protein